MKCSNREDLRWGEVILKKNVLSGVLECLEMAALKLLGRPLLTPQPPSSPLSVRHHGICSTQPRASFSPRAEDRQGMGAHWLLQ